MSRAMATWREASRRGASGQPTSLRFPRPHQKRRRPPFGSYANGMKLSPNVRCINTLQVSGRALRSLVRAMHGGMTAWDVTVSRPHSSRIHET
jgi:hypothetical protein